MDTIQSWLAAWSFVEAYWPRFAGGSAAVVILLRIAALAYSRRPKTEDRTGDYFKDTKLLSPPLTRPAYSDRMAYVLAEMSDLAYYPFERTSGVVDDAVTEALTADLTTATNVRTFLNDFSTRVMSGRHLSRAQLASILENSGFSLLGVIAVAETQGFVCKRTVDGEPPYLILAFRGTEKNVSDWLTDARCVPVEEGSSKVHRGFLEAFTTTTDAQQNTARQEVERLLNLPAARANDKPLPLFITGHSLGGALALIATRLVAPNIDGACYTFGAPRVGNYEYFRFVKTPVYRIVNSVDPVPRVPLGPAMVLLIGLTRAVSWTVRLFIPGLRRPFDWLERMLDKLNGYRHFGDMRYLSDVGEGKFHEVRLLTNPPVLDRAVWAARRMGRSLLVPIKSHGMRIYRRKLLHIANDRSRL